MFSFFFDLVQTPTNTGKSSLNDSWYTPLHPLDHEEPDIKMDNQGCYKSSNQRIHHLSGTFEQRLITHTDRNASVSSLTLPSSSH